MQEIDEIYDDLKRKFSKMSDYELMTLSIQINKNHILQRAFAVTKGYPSALETIGMQMGYSSTGGTTTLPEAIESIANRL